MKHLKLWENLNENGDFYSKFWIEALSEKYGTCEIDEYKPIKPLYGGGKFSQIGYLCNVEDKDVSKFILEGITNNGKFIHSSIITLDQNGDALSHGTIYIDNTKGDTYSDNILKVVDEIDKYIENM
jgi:hypothetical protein